MHDTGSGKPLSGKLGLRPGMEIAILGAPDGYEALLAPVWDALTVHRALPGFRLAWLQVFVDDAAALDEVLPDLVAALQPNGQLWVSWRKGRKGPGVLNESLVREVGLAHGVVDIKVAAVDAVWSGLKFVIRLKDRKGSRT